MKTRLLLASAVLALTACVVNPMKTAETTEQKADAYYGMFVISQEAAVRIAQDPATPQSVKVALRDADRVAKPLADGLHDAIVKFQAVKDAYTAALAAGNADPAALVAAEKELSTYLISVIHQFNKYRELVNASKRGGDAPVPTAHEIMWLMAQPA